MPIVYAVVIFFCVRALCSDALWQKPFNPTPAIIVSMVMFYCATELWMAIIEVCK